MGVLLVTVEQKSRLVCVLGKGTGVCLGWGLRARAVAAVADFGDWGRAALGIVDDGFVRSLGVMGYYNKPHGGEHAMNVNGGMGRGGNEVDALVNESRREALEGGLGVDRLNLVDC